ncbi:cation:proton antiporter [Synechococcus sp. ATX 2A4]|uniref:cation:proton antiporter domain-containing protein n=1 Tax=Synechococcus sp. ATX 2A4 TaxID=2823727 RepID=UPI0020CD200F|nr:cation:proton antiporter [Synechococcus sp. ATX 2A4]MCP9884683.1 cation:proton antiporter [Synechococcus sp. ATX 2A4]
MTPSEPVATGLQLSLPGVLAIISATYLATLVASRVAVQLRVPAILGILLLGVAIQPGPSLLSVTAVDALNTVTLSMLLFVAGLNSDTQHIRGFLGYGVLLAVGGVAVSSLLLGGLIWLVFAGLGNPIPLTLALLVAACLGSTDAGATLSVLRGVQDRIPVRVRSLLEFESSVNDPAAILFLFLILGLSGQGGSEGGALLDQLQGFIRSVGSGILVGLILTYLAQFVLNRLITSQDQILVVGIAIALASYGFASLLGGSGFIAAYVTGLFLANNIYDNKLITPELLEHSLEPFNTTMQITVFLLFGVLIDATSIPGALLPGALVALGLMLVARPLSVLVFQRWSPFDWRAGALISWCGLRGAVPIALGYSVTKSLPSLPGLSSTELPQLENLVEAVIFVVVFFNLCVQGLSLPWLCRQLKLETEA